MLSAALAFGQCTYSLVIAAWTRSSARCQSWHSRMARRLREASRVATKSANSASRDCVIGGTSSVLCSHCQDGSRSRFGCPVLLSGWGQFARRWFLFVTTRCLARPGCLLTQQEALQLPGVGARQGGDELN